MNLVQLRSARGGLVGIVAAMVVACGGPVPSPSAAPSATPSASSAASSTPLPPPVPSLPILSTAVDACAYIPGTPVASLPPQETNRPPEPPLPAPTAVDAATTNRQLEILNELWRVVDRNYVNPERTGSEWQDVRTKYRAVVSEGLAEDDFYTVLELMVRELGDEHSTFDSPAEVGENKAALEGQNDYGGIGAILQATADDALVIIAIWPGSPAEDAGLRPHDLILTADGQVPVDDDGRIRGELIRGPEGTTVTLAIRRPGGAARDAQVTRRRIQGPTPIDVCMIRGTRILYVPVLTLFDRTVDDQIGDALEKLDAEGPLDGVILDNRMNGGGEEGTLKAVLGFFVDGEVGRFRTVDDNRPMEIEGVDLAGSQRVPVVVLVGPRTVSFGEVLSGVLQAKDRARVVGETTLGNVEILHGYDLSDGSIAWIAHETFEADGATYGPWEETGIVPDRVVPAPWAAFNEATDPALPVALELLGVP